jgi:hypothetical protein
VGDPILAANMGYLHQQQTRAKLEETEIDNTRVGDS